MNNELRSFLTKILNDKKYRAQVEKEPEKTLTSLGVQVRPGQVPTPARLPSDDEIRALLVLDKAMERFPNGGCLSWFVICGWPKP